MYVVQIKRRSRIKVKNTASFTLYHYIFSFLLILLLMGLSALAAWLQLPITEGLFILFILIWGFYLYQGLPAFYGQGWLRTFGNFIVLNLLQQDLE